MTDTIKQHDTWPYLEFHLIDEDGENINCTDLEVKFVARNWKKETVIETIVGEERVDLSGAFWITNVSGTGEDTGEGEYHWASGDTKNQGLFEYEFKIIRTDDKKFTFPKTGYFSYIVEENIAE